MDTSYKNINIMIPAELHNVVKRKALEGRITLRQYVTLALEEKARSSLQNAYNGILEREDMQ